MSNGFFKVPRAINEPVRSYKAGSADRTRVLEQYESYYNGYVEVPLYIGSDQIISDRKAYISPPHEHAHRVGAYQLATNTQVLEAINAAMSAREKWALMPWEERAAIFLKAAELLSGTYRYKINAATMLAQSKTIHQAEIDAACELIDFLRFNVQFMQELYHDQPESSSGVWNRTEHRPLEGFVYAVTPFNFTAIAGNLPSSAAMMGNVVVWKPSDSQIFSAQVIMEVFQRAGLPPGVINMITGDPAMITDTVLSDSNFAGIHFTGSTTVFKDIWKKIGENITYYHSYPRIVGETGGKDFIWAHSSANPKEVATGIVRGAFELQGQKCSAASRIYLPESLADEVINYVKEDLDSFQKPGSPADMGNFITAVIHEGAFNKLVSYIEGAKKAKEAKVIAGGGNDKSIGYFIEPTVILTTDPHYVTMREELFGPIVTVYVYSDKDWKASLKLVDETSVYALTGAIFSQDRYVIAEATRLLENSAGNFYINDKPTGAVVGQQPFGGARASGTNDKAGSKLNLLRWVSQRTIKETFVPPADYRYPFLEK